MSDIINHPVLLLVSPRDGQWFWGHELAIFESSHEEAYSRWMDSYGTTYRIKGALFHPDIIVTGDQGAVDCILRKKCYSHEKALTIRSFAERLIGRGLVWAEGNEHKRQRQQLSPFFTTQAIRDTFGTINACAHKGVDNLEEHIGENAGNPKQGLALNITEWTSSITLDVIGRFAFNYDFESGRSPAAQVLKHLWHESEKAGLHWSALLGQVTARAFPFLAYILFPFLESQVMVKRKLHEIAQSIIDGDVNEGKEKDMLTTMVRLTDKGEISSTKEELFDHVSTMVVAGQETTSGSLGFTLHLLAKNPKYQTRLREEILQLGREPTYDDLTLGMPWLDTIMKESFRQRPLVSHMERVATEDCVLKLENPAQAGDGSQITEVAIKAGQVIYIPIIAMNQIKSVWGEDANEFKPERWFDSAMVERVNKNLGWNGMLGFSGGPRLCIGYRLAILTFKAILAAYIRKFDFHDTGVAVRSRFVGTVQSFVAGEEDKGIQMPLRVSLLAGELEGN
ncbi:cytochrome P450 [Rhizoctonia solani]|nr:cytochrome P450 [Rhizoctonia solani]